MTCSSIDSGSVRVIGARGEAVWLVLSQKIVHRSFECALGSVPFVGSTFSALTLNGYPPPQSCEDSDSYN